MEWDQCKEVTRESGKVGGAWVFKGTRVPVRVLLENVEDGATDEEFLELQNSAVLN